MYGLFDFWLLSEVGETVLVYKLLFSFEVVFRPVQIFIGRGFYIR